ncbi:class I SAM-dependent methyltransferase [Mesorhizobium sp. AR07]|nr:class I SAM-dependent methyltransferase [Mesorhizobium sp. AR07]
MSPLATNSSSTGHEASNAEWLDLHFESSRPEYEQALLAIGIQPGWAVLDAGCGGGGFLPALRDLVGPSGTIDVIDLAPENISRVKGWTLGVGQEPAIHAQTGNVLELPFADASFDCVWSANVMQYLTPSEFVQAVREACRVLKPGGTLAIKDFDSTLLHMLPIDRGVLSRFMTIRLQAFRDKGVLGTDCGSTLPARLRAAGVTPLWRKGWLVERWAPVSPFTRAYVADLLAYFASVSATYDLSEADRNYWQRLGQNPGELLDQPDFCYRELFVLTVCRMA